MFRKQYPLTMQKQLFRLLHVFFLLLLIAGVSFIRFNENYGRGLTWLHEESYADTQSFTEQLESDVDMIFQYVQYKDLFETDDLLDYDKDMVCVTFNSGKTMIYSLNDMIREAKSLGYYLTDQYEIAGGPAVHERDQEDAAVPLVEWKTYDPYMALTYSEPGDAYQTREELSLEVLSLLADYYRIQNNYIARPSNLYFQVSYMDGEGHQHLYTNAGQYSVEELTAFGRYLYINGDSIMIDTNLAYVPRNITSDLERYNLYGNNNYYIALGVDTRYPNSDPYSAANREYSRVRVDYLAGLLLVFFGGCGMAVTLLWLAAKTGLSRDTDAQVSLLPWDRFPVELRLLAAGGLLLPERFLLLSCSDPVLQVFFGPEVRPFAAAALLLSLQYLTITLFFFSLLRNLRTGSLARCSLICHFLVWCRASFSRTSFPVRSILIFSGYLGSCGILYRAWYLLYHAREELSHHSLYLIPVCLLILLQVIIFFLLCRQAGELEHLADGIFAMSEGHTDHKMNPEEFSGKNSEIARSLNNLGDGLQAAIQEQVRSERMKADLITNVSHDLKTPLTSIINYVDLLKRQNIQDETARGYLQILEQKSLRLKNLTEDLVEASKASSGNLKLDMTRIDFVEMIQQTNGEFEEKFAEHGLEIVSTLPQESILILADGRRLWRILENLYNNAFKYAMEHTRVYIDLIREEDTVCFTMKNVSARPLNIKAEELTERFVRGDVARTTEGSGLGLSIAQSLTRLQKGEFILSIDGDLFKASVRFPVLPPETAPEAPESTPGET